MSNIELNKKMFGRRIKQLDHILKDNTFLTDGSYREFVVSMYKALVTGRKITPKMESAITKIVHSYTKTLNPEYKKKKLDYTENLIKEISKNVERKSPEIKTTEERSLYKIGGDILNKTIDNSYTPY